jgi:hypothetical protein
MKRFRRLAAAVREVFNPQPWDPPERDETTTQAFAEYVAKSKHPPECMGGCRCIRGGEEV